MLFRGWMIRGWRNGYRVWEYGFVGFRIRVVFIEGNKYIGGGVDVVIVGCNV